MDPTDSGDRTGPTGPTVRHATADDLDAWREVRLRSLAESPDAFGSTAERELAFTDDDWRARLSPPAVLVEHHGRPVGLGGGFLVRPGTLHVVAMWVDPAWRGRGLSRRVLDLVVGWARARDLDVELDVARGNPAARAAYERYGFVYTGEQSPLRPGSPVVIDRMVLPRSPG